MSFTTRATGLFLATITVAVVAAGRATGGQARFARAPFQPGGEIGPAPSAEKPAGPEARLDGALGRVLASANPLAAARAAALLVRDGRLQVHLVVVEGGGATVADLLAVRGARNVSAAGDLVQADVTPEMLRALVERADVLAIRRPRYAPRPEPVARKVSAFSAAGAFTTEGLAAMNAPAWHSAGFTGQGVKVGVIDAGFGGWESLRGTELPEASKVHLQTFGGLTVQADQFHGTACAEIIHDVAPSAEMYLALVSTEVDIADAVSWMKANGVTVISMSLGWLSWGPGDGTGHLATVVNTFVAGGGVWVNSGGNSRLAHWQGGWRDDDGDGYLNFTSTSEVNYITADGANAAIIPAGTTITASMVWNQWSAPLTDIDFYLYEDDGSGTLQQVAGSEGPQDGTAGQQPVEEFTFTTTEDAAYGFAVKGVSGPANVDIEFFNRLDANPLQFDVPDGSITPPADAAGAITAAALDAGSPYNLESYSSRGPTNGPGGALLGGSIKPDISGYAVVSTQSYGARGENAFSGTSSACPHVAGAAALVRSAYPAYTAAQVRSLLESRAIDMGPGGKDLDYGYGRLTLGAPPAASCDAPSVPGFLTGSPVQPTSGSPYTIGWTAATNATGYELQEATNSGFTGATTATVSGTSTTLTHTVATGTTYYYRVRAVRSCGATSSTSAYSSTLSVTVSVGGGTTTSLWVPVATRASGANSSQWRTDLGLLNLGGATATCQVVFKSGAAVKTYQTTVAGGRHVILRDVVGPTYLNGSGSGSLEVRSSQSVLVTSRTYNQNANGTFGQDYPSYDPAGGLAAGQTATLPHLTENAAYRSNIGLVNMGTAAAMVTVALIDGTTGSQAGTYTVSLQPGEWKQESQPFLKKAGKNNIEAGYARVSVTAGAGVVAVASVIDNNINSNDPTTITMQR